MKRKKETRRSNFLEVDLLDRATDSIGSVAFFCAKKSVTQKKSVRKKKSVGKKEKCHAEPRSSQSMDGEKVGGVGEVGGEAWCDGILVDDIVG